MGSFFLQAEDGIRDLTVTGVQTCSFFFQAEDGIRDLTVTGVQTCALPISALLLGDGSFLSLAQIKSMPNVFSGVDLLTLSACNTATGGAANGDRKSVV